MRLEGFQITENQHYAKNQLYTVTKEIFYKSTKKYFHLWKPMGLNNGLFTITFNAQDHWSGLTNKMKVLFEQTSMLYLQSEEKGIMKVSLYNTLLKL